MYVLHRSDLSLAHNHVTSSGAAGVVQALLQHDGSARKLESSKSLRLTPSRTRLHDHRSAPRTTTSFSLTRLNLSSNALCAEGVESIATALIGNHHLRSLVLNKCELGSWAGKALGRGLSQNTVLQRLECVSR